MLLLIMILTFVCVAFGSIGLYWMVGRGNNPMIERLLSVEKPKEEAGPSIPFEPEANLAERVAKPLIRLAPPSSSQGQKLQRQMRMAGYFSRRAPSVYRAIQTASLFGLPTLGLAIGFLSSQSMLTLATVGAAALIAGFLLPRFVLKKLIKRRHERLSWGLADALDLMVVSMEAGLGINQALMRVSEELKGPHPEISSEFEMVNFEIRVGRDRLQALHNLADRTGVDELRGFVAMLIQADRFGSSIGRAVRIYSESLRTKRRQLAEQAAQKASVKLLLPLTCFLFPTLFIIILGPAALSLMDAFGGGSGK